MTVESPQKQELAPVTTFESVAAALGGNIRALEEVVQSRGEGLSDAERAAVLALGEKIGQLHATTF